MNVGVQAVLDNRQRWAVECGDCLEFLKSLPDGCIHCLCTSPPYWALREYGVEGQIGQESTPFEFIDRLVELFHEARRILHPSGVFWLNLGDSYANDGKWGGQTGGKHRASLHDTSVGRNKRITGLKAKDRMMLPARVAMALQADGWYLRDEIIWSKPSPMPMPVRDRTVSSHEMIYLLSKSPRYYFDVLAIAEPAKTAGKPMKMADGWDTGSGSHGSIHRQGREKGQPKAAIQGATRNKRSVWTIASQPYKGSHFATFPPKLVTPWILAGSSERGVCPKCLAPWVRQVKRDRKPTRPGTDSKVLEPNDSKQDGVGSRVYTGFNQRYKKSHVIGNRDPQRHCTITETTGWEPSCKCGVAETIPALCLDPFLGSGTVAAVAVGLGRRCIGSELNPAYIPLIEKRMSAVQPQITGLAS